MRKIALFSDIHGNFCALKSILEDINKNRFDDVICLGDLVGIGPDSSLCLKEIIDSNVIMLLGNHELYQTRGVNIDNLSEEVIEHEKWVNSNLDSNDLAFLKECKLQYEILENGKLFSFSHFFIKGQEDYPFYPLSIVNDGSISSICKNISCDYFFFGHEHNSFMINNEHGSFYCLGSSGCTNSNITFYTVLEIYDDEVKVYKKYLKYDRSSFESVLMDNDYPALSFISKTFFDIDLKKITKEKSCGAVVYKKESDVLFLVLQHKKGHYSFPKGHVEDGETEVETAVREIKEETNLDVEIDEDFRFISSYYPKFNVLKDVVFFVGEAKSFDIVVQEKEISNANWYSYEDAINLITYDRDKELLKEAYKYLLK